MSLLAAALLLCAFLSLTGHLFLLLRLGSGSADLDDLIAASGCACVGTLQTLPGVMRGDGGSIGLDPLLLERFLARTGHRLTLLACRDAIALVVAGSVMLEAPLALPWIWLAITCLLFAAPFRPELADEAEASSRKLAAAAAASAASRRDAPRGS